MSVTTRLQPRFLIQRIAMIVICLVLGLWGVYDYAVKIPNAEALVARSAVYADALDAIQASGDEAVPRAEVEAAALKAKASIEAAMAAVPEGTEPGNVEPQIQPRNASQWKSELILMATVIQTYVNAPPGQPIAPEAVRGAELIRDRKNVTAEVTPPTKFDRLTQWFFILCLPFVPWYAWTFVVEARRRHTLADDGSFSGPHGRWEQDEIADVDMSQWMRKSVAWVQHRDGRREKLDDYVHRGVEQIMGSLASRLHPDAWTEEAKPVKKDAAEAEGSDAVAATESPADSDGPGDEPPDQSVAAGDPADAPAPERTA